MVSGFYGWHSGWANKFWFSYKQFPSVFHLQNQGNRFWGSASWSSSCLVQHDQHTVLPLLSLTLWWHKPGLPWRAHTHQHDVGDPVLHGRQSAQGAWARFTSSPWPELRQAHFTCQLIKTMISTSALGMLVFSPCNEDFRYLPHVLKLWNRFIILSSWKNYNCAQSSKWFRQTSNLLSMLTSRIHQLTEH